MSPVGVGASRFASALETGVAKFWVLLVGVDRYHDLTLPALRYAAIDCQGIGAALAAATGAFPDREFLIHHDLVAETPTLERVETSLHRIVTQAQPQDTILIYFSGHGVVDPSTQQTILCLQDTDREHLLTTGLQIQIVLKLLEHCAAHSQLLWLDACHSGNLNFIGTNRDSGESIRLNPIVQLLSSLRHQAALSRGFYALLSCDEGQQSWEFPDLGHGVFSYYLMRGLQGEAADERGVIDADSLYRYVYRQTVQYIDLTNQQLRRADRQQRDRRGTEVSWCPEYSAQTPKRIVSGVGEIILGLKPQPNAVAVRSALIVAAGADRIGPISLVPLAPSDDGDDLSGEQIAAEIGHALEREGKFTLDYFPTPASTTAVGVDPAASLRQRIQSFLAEDATTRPFAGVVPTATSTRLLYLRGQITAHDGVDAWFVLEDGVKLSRAWLQQELQRASQSQQMIILDCLGGAAAAEWIDALKITDPDSSRWMIASAAEAEDADLFARVLLETLISAPPQLGMPIASLFTRLATNLDRLGIPCHVWLCDPPGSIETLPGTVESDLAVLLPVEEPDFALPKVDSTLEVREITVGQDVTKFQPQIAVNPSIDLTQSLESILYRLVGPIAPALLKAATATIEDVNRDPTNLIHNLQPLLPERARAEFDLQVNILLTHLPDRVETPPAINQPTKTSRSAQPLPTAMTTTDRGYFPSVTRQAVEQTLKETIGPVAEVLLGQIAPTAWASDRALLDALTPYLSAARLAEFAGRLQPLLESLTAATIDIPPAAPHNANGRGISNSSSRTAQALSVDDNLKTACERELIQAIGPVAKFIIATTHKTHPQICPADFVNILATQIPDPTQSAAFRQKMEDRVES
jgi:uncharacterized caspase-like protein